MVSPPQIKVSTPRNATIGKYVAYYYFMDGGLYDEEYSFWHYPHFYSTLNLFKNGRQAVVRGRTFILPDERTTFACAYSDNLTGARQATVRGPHHIIGIVFRPLGVNHFGLAKLLGNQVELPADTTNTPRRLLDGIFASGAIPARTGLLDELLLRTKKDFSVPLLERALSRVIASEGTVQLNDLAQSLSVTRRTLLRYFRQHLNGTFQDFRAVVKFRAALRKGAGVNSGGKMSDLAYAANYYDQSDFIRQFKRRANETPRKALPRVSRVADELYWKVL